MPHLPGRRAFGRSFPCVRAHDCPARRWILERLSLKETRAQARRDAERQAIRIVLAETRWNRRQTARILGISYRALLYKIKATGLDRVAADMSDLAPPR